tara:strand:+ start:195 stop:416 length:222 start_codon:yes stop_codon:yes gene_type:complete
MGFIQILLTDTKQNSTIAIKTHSGMLSPMKIQSTDAHSPEPVNIFIMAWFNGSVSKRYWRPGPHSGTLSGGND